MLRSIFCNNTASAKASSFIISQAKPGVSIRTYRSMSGIAESKFPGNYSYETLNVSSPRPLVIHIEMNRPEKRNAMTQNMWRELTECFTRLGGDSNCNSVVLTGTGKTFCAGIDLQDLSQIFMGTADMETSRRAFVLKKFIEQAQRTFTCIEKCPKPVIAAVHGGCVGAGVDMISSCDIRVSTKDAWFQIKEVDIGLAADVGTLQRLPKAVGNDSLVRELVYTARKLGSDEASQLGLLSRVFPSVDAMITSALDLAEEIAAKSPVAVQGSKINLNYSRDHTVDESLDYMAIWNMSMLQSEDLMKAAMAAMEKRKSTFSKL